MTSSWLQSSKWDIISSGPHSRCTAQPQHVYLLQEVATTSCLLDVRGFVCFFLFQPILNIRIPQQNTKSLSNIQKLPLQGPTYVALPLPQSLEGFYLSLTFLSKDSEMRCLKSRNAIRSAFLTHVEFSKLNIKKPASELRVWIIFNYYIPAARTTPLRRGANTWAPAAGWLTRRDSILQKSIYQIRLQMYPRCSHPALGPVLRTNPSCFLVSSSSRSRSAVSARPQFRIFVCRIVLSERVDNSPEF